MEVIPLTLAISLLLSLTFIVLFVQEFTRPRRAGADRDSLLPLEADLMHASVPAAKEAKTGEQFHGHGHDHDHGHNHAAGAVCAGKRADGGCCASCQRRKDRVAAKPAAAAQS
jgi:hypothetical protein